MEDEHLVSPCLTPLHSQSFHLPMWRYHDFTLLVLCFHLWLTVYYTYVFLVQLCFPRHATFFLVLCFLCTSHYLFLNSLEFVNFSVFSNAAPVLILAGKSFLEPQLYSSEAWPHPDSYAHGYYLGSVSPSSGWHTSITFPFPRHVFVLGLIPLFCWSTFFNNFRRLQ